MGVTKGYYPGATWDGNAYGLAGYQSKERSIYSEEVDGNIKYGSSVGLLRRPLVGDAWGKGSMYGSRSVDCHLFPVYTNGINATRGCNKR